MLKATMPANSTVGDTVVGNPWCFFFSRGRRTYELFDRRRVSWKPMWPGTVLNAIRHVHLIFQGIFMFIVVIYRKWTQSLFFHPHGMFLAAFQCVQHVSVCFVCQLQAGWQRCKEANRKKVRSMRCWKGDYSFTWNAVSAVGRFVASTKTSCTCKAV